jgi:hypothetical protein
MSYTMGINDEIWGKYKGRLHALFCGPGNVCEEFFNQNNLGPLDRMMIAEGVRETFSSDAKGSADTWSKLRTQFPNIPDVFQDDEALFLKLIQALRSWRPQDVLFDIGLVVRKYYEQCEERLKTMRSCPPERPRQLTPDPDNLIAAILGHSLDAQVGEALTLVGHPRDKAVESYQSMEDAAMDLVQVTRGSTSEQRQKIVNKLRALLRHDDWNVRRCAEFVCDNAEPGRWPNCPRCGTELARSACWPLILLCPGCPYKQPGQGGNE